MDDGVDLVPARQKFIWTGAGGMRDIAMNIAIANVTEGNEPGAGNSGCHGAENLFEKHRNRSDRHAYIMLDRGAFAGLRLRQKLAQLPEIVTLFERRGDCRVFDK